MSLTAIHSKRPFFSKVPCKRKWNSQRTREKTTHGNAEYEVAGCWGTINVQANCLLQITKPLKTIPKRLMTISIVTMIMLQFSKASILNAVSRSRTNVNTICLKGPLHCQPWCNAVVCFCFENTLVNGVLWLVNTFTRFPDAKRQNSYLW